MLNIGDRLPPFSVLDDHGRPVTDADLAHGDVVLYFYPKDDTPGCTKQACGLRDAQGEYQARGIRVFGISADDVASHVAFREKFDLNFPLLADTEKVLCNAFGVYGEQEWKGQKYMGIARNTYLFKEGVLTTLFPNVDVLTHADRVLQAIG